MGNQKDLHYYLSLPYTFQVRKTESGYWANVKELDGCHTPADTIQEAYTDLEKVLRDHIEIKLGFSDPIPEPVDQDYSGKFNVRVPKTLHKHLAQEAESEGVSLNQYIVYKLSK
ncbi:type II toxin-antitoxin system HicB family antitoxin [Solibacillus daqui]|uniref:type II toxin-antitoxin system HicB family antitoxin n=1 Tax=Solibacillus daqui TaxID=2912187 RepID=UPI002366345D|nr:type II toxin-antitoxin system HicB family antitoxin [Solibacillus daqui]